VADEDALAGRQPVGLDDLRPGGAALEVGLGRTRAVEAAVGGAGDLVALEELLREGLRALDARARGAWAEREDVRGAELVRETETEGLLGSDDDEVDLLAAREIDEAEEVVRGDGDVLGVLGGARDCRERTGSRERAGTARASTRARAPGLRRRRRVLSWSVVWGMRPEPGGIG
jgi:hypothetical protein